MKLFHYVLLINAIAFFITGLIFENSQVLLFSTILIVLSNIVYSIHKFNERVIFFCFNITFFIFLQGRMVVTEYFGYKNDLLGKFGLAFYENYLINQTLISIFLSLIGLFIGHVLIKKINLSFLDKRKSLSPGYIISLRTFSLIFFLFCMIFRLYYVFEMQQSAATEGYFESFADFRSSLPVPLEIISRMYDVAFFSYLATMPSKKKSLFPIALYIGEGLLSAMAGRRSIFMLNILIVFIYFCLRNISTKAKKITTEKMEKKWFGKFEWTTSIIALPIILVGMTMIGRLRQSNWTSSGERGFFDQIYEFFYSQGISVNLIGYTKLYGDSLPDDKIYSLGPIFEFIDNRIIRPIIGAPELFGQTLERALDGYLYAHAISYAIMPDLYLRGIGYGSSFVAEFYKDGSYFGVFFGSITYGMILYISFRIMRNSHFIILVFGLMMIRSIMFAPRGAVLSFIVSSFSVPKILAIIIILLGAKLIHLMSKNTKIIQSETT